MQADAEIVRAVLRGDREEFAALVARHERSVWATAWRVLRDDHAAADAGQEAFLQALTRPSTVVTRSTGRYTGSSWAGRFLRSTTFSP